MKRIKTADEEHLRRVATHEAGHAVYEWVSPCFLNVLRVTIRPNCRGNLGESQFLQKSELSLLSELVDSIASRLAGIVAEKMFGYEPSTGAHGDLDSATRIAKTMVLECGMGQRVGNRVIDDDEHVSDRLRDDVDRDIRQILKLGRWLAKRTLRAYQGEIGAVVELLMEHKTIYEVALEEVLGPKA